MLIFYHSLRKLTGLDRCLLQIKESYSNVTLW